MTNTIKALPKKLSRKEVRKLVYEKLSGALAEFKAGIKEKRFTANLKKATKLLATDIARTINKKEKAPKAPKKKIKAVPAEDQSKEAS